MAQKEFMGQIPEFNRYGPGKAKEEVTMDLIDKKIVYFLHENARYSNTFLAKKLRVKRETVAYRIKRMVEQDFLQGYFTLLDTRRLGFKNYLVYLKLKALNREKEFLDYLLCFKEVVRLSTCSGSYDLQVTFSVKNEEEFVNCFGKITGKYEEALQQREIFSILEEDFLGMGILFDKEEAKLHNLIEHKGSAFCQEMEAPTQTYDTVQLDEKDKFILEAVALNSRVGINELSSKICLAPPAVKNRIKNMIQSGVIKRFYPLVSLSKLGYQWWMVFFKVRNLEKARFLTFLKYHANVLWYMRLLGRWDYHISIFAKDNAEFHKILDEIRTEFTDTIVEYDSLIIFNQFKYVQRVD